MSATHMPLSQAEDQLTNDERQRGGQESQNPTPLYWSLLPDRLLHTDHHHRLKNNFMHDCPPPLFALPSVVFPLVPVWDCTIQAAWGGPEEEAEENKWLPRGHGGAKLSLRLEC